MTSNLGVGGVPSPQAVDSINAISSTPYQIFIVKILDQIVLGTVSINSGVEAHTGTREILHNQAIS